MSAFGSHRKNELHEHVEEFLQWQLEDGRELSEVLMDLHEVIGYTINDVLATKCEVKLK